MEKHIMGVHFIKKEAEGEDPADVGVILMENLRAPARACAAMLGVIYATNLAYPKELRCYDEFIQKVVMQMNGEKIYPKTPCAQKQKEHRICGALKPNYRS
uniref:Uncharacterized protein n=1 Tax=Oryzias sinensis TaxID=183150 RepID=A0A8C8DEG6_9TELE